MRVMATGGPEQLSTVSASAHRQIMRPIQGPLSMALDGITIKTRGDSFARSRFSNGWPKRPSPRKDYANHSRRTGYRDLLIRRNLPGKRYTPWVAKSGQDYMLQELLLQIFCASEVFPELMRQVHCTKDSVQRRNPWNALSGFSPIWHTVS